MNKITVISKSKKFIGIDHPATMQVCVVREENGRNISYTRHLRYDAAKNAYLGYPCPRNIYSDLIEYTVR